MSTQVLSNARRLGRLRRFTVAAVAVVAATCLAACTANVTARTADPYNPAQGTQADSGDLAIRSAVVVSDTDGKGSLTMVLVNNADQANSLTAVDVADAGLAVISSGSISIPAHATVKVGLTPAIEVATGDVTNPVTIAVSGTAIVAGGATSVTLTFGASPSVTMPVLVVPHEGEFKSVAMPTPTPAAAGS